MVHTKSDSDVTSFSSPPRSPKRTVYYVQSPSRDSLSMHPTPVYAIPMESPSPPSYGRHSRSSSASRISGTFGHKGSQKTVNDKGWPECNVIQEEGSYGDLDGDEGLSRRCQVVLALLAFVVMFTVFCLIIWGASRHYRPEVVVKSLSVKNFNSGEGSDDTGVPTKLVTVNCSMKINVYNPASIFGIHVVSDNVNLVYSQITIGTGQLEKYYQPRKSHRTVTVVIEGNKVPVYGAGASLALSAMGGAVPLTLDFELFSRGNVVGKLVTVKQRRHISCPLIVDSGNSKPVKFSQNLCIYN